MVVPPELRRDLQITMHPVRHMVRLAGFISLPFILLSETLEASFFTNKPKTMLELILPILVGVYVGFKTGFGIGAIDVLRATRRLNRR